MTTTATVTVKSLPIGIRNVLDNVGYKRPDVALCAKDAVYIRGLGGNGFRCHASIVANVDTIGGEQLWGSWGGPNMFASSAANPVDSEREPRAVPELGAVVTGSAGGSRPVSATVYVRPLVFLRLVEPSNDAMVVARDAIEAGRAVPPELLAEAMTTPSTALSPLLAAVLEVFCGIKGGHRPQYLAELADGRKNGTRISPPPGAAAVADAVETLVSYGYLKRASNGATSVTTKGKNARPRGEGK